MAPAPLSIRPAALLLDLDGTLIDSEPLWARAIRELVDAHGLPWSPSDAAANVGLAVPDTAARLLAHGVDLPAGQVVDLLHDRVAELEAGEVPWRPGAVELLTALVTAGIPSALVTMTYRRLAGPVAAAAPPGSLTVVVAGDDVSRGKPDPECYLAAAAALGVPATRCVAAEDSVAGTRAALASGAVTVAVEPAMPLPDDVTGHPRLRRLSGLAELLEVLDLG